MPTFSHTQISQTSLLNRLLTLSGRHAILRLSQLRNSGIHHQILSRAVDRGLVAKIGRGLYISADRPLDLEHRIILSCQRVPHGVVCLESALRFHGILPPHSDVVWMAIDRKARKPVVRGLELHFVRFSGQALTQGVVNMTIHGESIRVFSVAKTVADCLKYRRKIDPKTVGRAVQEGMHETKCTRERLVHFARICRVERLVREIGAMKLLHHKQAANPIHEH